jgi:ATP/maltotriose-dependent transcriptional regulator MalT/two-component SAPR family response regulator
MKTIAGIPVSRNKIHVPHRRRELITRPRLIDGLYEQMDKKLLLVVAPAGYGKTSLLVDLAQQTEMPVCWLTLDPLDQDPQRFLGYLTASIAMRFRAFGRDSRAALESMTSFERDAERILVTITNEIAAQINEHFLLILDDYHLVEDSPFAGPLINRFVQLTGENVHLILASRALPNLPDSPLLVARNQIGGLSYEDLSFSADEIQRLFQQNNGIELSRQEADTLVEQTEGWIAAIHLSNGKPGSIPRMRPLESTRELFDFFLQEVLLRQTEQVRQFLLMTSLFETFDVKLCKNVLEPLMEGESLDWETLFHHVRTNNIFSVPVGDEGDWIRYHHLFRHFLRSKFQYEHPVLSWHIQHSLARAYEAQQSWDEAFHIYAQLDDTDNQIRLLKSTGSHFIAAGRIPTLERWLKRLSDEIIYSQPVLVSLLGIIHAFKGENRQALELYNLADGKLRADKDDVAWITNLVRRAEIFRQLGDFDRAISDSEEILETTKENALPEMQLAFAEAQRIRGLASYGLGHMEEALRWLQKSLRTSKTLGISNKVPILETEIGVVYRRLGKPEITERYYSNALEAWKDSGNTGWKARLLNNLGLLYHMTGRLKEAYSSLHNALETARRSGYLQIETNIMISLADLLTDLSELESAYDYYDKALTQATHLGNSLYIFYASLGEARLQRLGGEPLLAVEEINHAVIAQVKLGLFERALYNLELGICWLDADKIEPAIVVLRDAVALFEEGGNQMEQAIARLWLETALSVQFPDTALQNLKGLLPSAREWQNPTPFMIHASRCAAWLRKRGNTRLFKDIVIGRFLRQAQKVRNSIFGLVAEIRQETNAPKTKIPKLEIVSFGEVQVRRDQRLVESSDWQTREARDLFFFLLQSPPLTKEQIALEFWPDISPARLKMRFKINIYRIRQALGQNVILYENEKYRFNREIHYTWDRQEVDKLLKACRSADSAGDMEIRNRALALMRGPYLADIDAEWAVADRLHYQEAYLDLLVELADMYLQSGRAKDCLRTAATALNADPLLESANRIAIQAYASLHDPVGMTQQYRQYQNLLMNELGLKPSSEISALYKQLLDTI